MKTFTTTLLGFAAILSPSLAFAAPPDTEWNRLVNLALSRPHTFMQECDARGCINTLKIKGTNLRLVRVAGHSGGEVLLICKGAKDCVRKP